MLDKETSLKMSALGPDGLAGGSIGHTLEVLPALNK